MCCIEAEFWQYSSLPATLGKSSMPTIVNIIFVIYVVVCGIGIFIGLDLKKWKSWLYGLYGFVSGLLIGLSRADVSGGLTLGLLFTFVVLYGGATSHWHRQRFK